MTLYAFQKMSCIDIKLKGIHKVVLYFDSVKIFYGYESSIYIYVGRKMRISVYSSEFHALQLSGIQFLLPENKRQKILATANTNTEHFQL